METVFLSSSSLGGGPRGSGGPRRSVQGGHWIMVYEYGYEHGYEKGKDQITKSETEGKIQYFTLVSISSLAHPQH